MITSDPNVMMGKPVIAGTRITVELILEKLAAGEPAAQIIASHPRLTEEPIRAGLAFAAEVKLSQAQKPASLQVFLRGTYCN